MEITASLADVIWRRVLARIWPWHVVDGNRCPCVRWETVEGDGCDHTGCGSDAARVQIMGHVDRLNGRPLRIAGRTRTGSAAWRREIVVRASIPIIALIGRSLFVQFPPKK